MTIQKIRKNLRVNIVGNATPPFLSFFHSDTIHIQFNSKDPVSIFDKSKNFYNCFQIKTNQDAIIDVLVPLTDTLYLSDLHGNKWILQTDYDKSNLLDVVKDFTTYYQTLIKGMTASFSFHAGLVLFFTSIYYISQQSEAIRAFVGLKSESIKTIQENLEIAVLRQVTPFSGMSLKEYTETYIENKRPEEKVKLAVSAMEKISGILNKNVLQGISGISEQITSKTGSTNLPKFDTKSLIAESLKETRYKENANANEKTIKDTAKVLLPNAPMPQFDKKEMMIRSTLQSLRPIFSQHFDEVLRIDPGLSVIVTYDAVIDSHGRLEKIRLSTKGNGATLAIETLKKKVLQSFESLQFSEEYAGTPIHGEQVFIK